MTENERSADVAPPRRKGCGCWTVTFVALLGAATFVVGVYGFWRWSNARGVERMIAVAREKGEPTTPEELAAAYPTSPEIEQTTRLWLNAMEQADRSELKDHVNAAIVGYGEPGDEAMRIAMDRFAKERIMSPAIYNASRAYLSRRVDAIESAHEARRSGSIGRFPLEHEVGENEDSEVYMRHRHMTNVLALELEVRRHEGRTDGIGEVLLTLTALPESARNHPARIFQEVRRSELNVARSQLLTALERDELSDADVTSLMQAWSEIDLVPSLRLVLFEYQTEALYSLPKGGYRYLFPDRRPCPEEDAYQAARMLRAIIDQADDLDAAESAAAAAEVELDRAMEAPFAKHRFAGWAMFGGAGVIARGLRYDQTLVESTVVLLACEGFRRENGDWPETIDELISTFLDQIPPDRYGGGRLKYRRANEGVAVYSVGDDKNDDGGTIKDRFQEGPSDFGVRLRAEPIEPGDADSN